MKLHHIDIGDRSRGHLCLWVPVVAKDNNSEIRDKVLLAVNEHDDLLEALTELVTIICSGGREVTVEDCEEAKSIIARAKGEVQS